MTHRQAPTDRIILLTDLSQASSIAFPYAKDLAQREKLPLELVHILASPIIPTVMFEYIPSAEEIDEVRKQMKTHAEAELTKLITREFQDIPTTFQVIEGLGAAADSIVDIARTRCRAIVMSTHGHGLLGRIALGSVAEGVLRRAPCPVLVCPIHSEKSGFSCGPSPLCASTRAN